MGPGILFFIILGIIYSGLFLQGVVRFRKTFSFAPSLKNSFIFYLSLLIVILIRLIAFSIIIAEGKSLSTKTAMILLYIPGTLFTLSFILLIWQMFSVYPQAHLKPETSGSILAFIGKLNVSPKYSKITGYIVFFITIWIGMHTVLYFTFIGGMLSSITLTREVIVSNLIIGGSGLILTVVLQVKFSSIPAKSKTWKSKALRITLVSYFWIFSRIVKEVVVLIMESFTLRISEEVADNGSDNIYTMCGFFIMILVSEIFPIFIVQDYEFIEIFTLYEEDDVGEMILVPVQRRSTKRIPLGRNNRFTMVVDNPFKREEEIEILEALDEIPNKLGKIYKAKFNENIVLYRKISFTRLSTYVCEEFTAEIASYKEILTENIIPVLGIILNNPIVGLISPFFINGSLYEHLHIKKTKFAFKAKLEIAIIISQALEEIHSIPRAHGHLSSYNILFDNHMKPNISDLGFTKVKKYAGIMLQYSNVNSWSSPEILAEKRGTVLKAKLTDDVYSFGMILWEIFTENIPFEGFSKEKLFQIVVAQGSRPAIVDIKTEIAEIIYNCWDPQPDKRPNFVDITEILTEISTN